MEQDVISIQKSIFRAYDIRGVVDETLTPAVVWAVGAAFGTTAQRKGITTVVVGRDGRLSGPVLLKALIAGLMSAGCEVIDIGCVPTPALYFATVHFKTGTGIMLTGSHNPPNYNGLKMMMDNACLAQSSIEAIYDQIQARDFQEGLGSVRAEDINGRYIEEVLKGKKLSRPLKIAIDAGNGSAGPLSFDALVKSGATVIPLFCDIDGNFPNHHPNPSEMKNLQALIECVQNNKADIGLAFDGDGDRLGVVTGKGEVIWPDQILALLSQSLLKRHPGARIIFDVKCSKHLAAAIEKAGGIPVMAKTGHSLIKSEMKAQNALLAGEMSGHLFFAEDWYGFDDAIVAAVRLAHLCCEVEDIQTLWDSLPKSYTTPEVNVDIPDDDKFGWMERFINNAKFPGGTRIDIDGLRVEYPDGWGLVRASNTTPCLVLRFEADTAEALKRIQATFKQEMNRIEAPALVVDF